MDLVIIFTVPLFLAFLLVGLVTAVRKYSKNVAKMPDRPSSDLFGNRDLFDRQGERPSEYSEDPFIPSCPPLPPPPPYTAVDNLQTSEPPSYSLLTPRSTQSSSFYLKYQNKICDFTLLFKRIPIPISACMISSYKAKKIMKH